MIKKKDIEIASLIFSFFVLFISIEIYTHIMTQALMGDVGKILAISVVFLILISMIPPLLSKMRFSNLFVGIFSFVYLFLTGFLLLRFLPTMRKISESYDHSGSIPVFGSFDPAGVDFQFYEILFTILLALFSIITVYSIAVAALREMKINSKRFKVVHSD